MPLQAVLRIGVAHALRERLLTGRVAFRLTQTELELKAGLPHGTIAQYEGGQRVPSAANLLLLANSLEVSIDYLVGRV